MQLNDEIERSKRMQRIGITATDQSLVRDVKNVLILGKYVTDHRRGFFDDLITPEVILKSFKI